MNAGPSDAGGSSISVAAAAGGAGAVVTVYGELDMATAPELQRALEREHREGEEVEIDLRACTFIDSTGVAVLVATASQLRTEGATMRIRGVRERVRRTFELAGLAEVDSIVLEPGA